METNLEDVGIVREMQRRHILTYVHIYVGFSGGSLVKNLPAKAGNMGSVPGLGRSPGRGHGSPLHYSCLENPTDR